MFYKANPYLFAVLLCAAIGMSGCIIDECGNGDFWDSTSCSHATTSSACSYNDDCSDYDDLGSDSHGPAVPSEADCDPILVAYDECVADFGDCFDPCASFLTEHTACVADIECNQWERGYLDCVEQFGVEFEACHAFAEEIDLNCEPGFLEETDTACDPTEPTEPPTPSPCPELNLAYEACTQSHCPAHESCVSIAFDLDLNGC